jgi:hypothetical protein
MRVDPGTAFVPRSRPVDLSPGVTLDFSQPGNATYKLIESFNGKFRAEYPNAHLFPSLEDVCRKCRQPDPSGEQLTVKIVAGGLSAAGTEFARSASIARRCSGRGDRRPHCQYCSGEENSRSSLEPRRARSCKATPHLCRPPPPPAAIRKRKVAIPISTWILPAAQRVHEMQRGVRERCPTGS